MSSDRFVDKYGKTRRHGNASAYEQGGCHCDRCTEAMRIRIEQRQAGKVIHHIEPPHVLPALPRAVTAHAKCKGKSDLFFAPIDGESFEQREQRKAYAKAVCAACPVQTECQDYAVEHRPWDGIWGGFTTSERKEYREELHALLRSRRRHPANPKPVEPKPAPTERVIGIPHSKNSYLGDRIA